MTIYRYGWIGWVWRALAVFGLVAAALFIYLALQLGNVLLVAAATILAVPSILLPWTLADRIDRAADGMIVVTNLFFVRRHIEMNALGPPRLRRSAHGGLPRVRAPRAWIPVQGGLPIYLDLYASIPEPATFRSIFKVAGVPGR